MALNDDAKILTVTDQGRMKRMKSNRESAKRSRIKKQQHLDELMSEMTRLQNENRLVKENVNAATQLHANFDSENNVLKAQVVELTDRLRSLNDVLHVAEDVRGVAIDIPEIPIPMLEPWHLPCPVKPGFMPSSNMFRC